MDDTVDRWFVREILVHEEALMRHLLRIWPNRDEIRDLCQETYVRVYESAQRSRPVAAKSFLFTTARNLITDRLRRGRVVSIQVVGDLEELQLMVDEVTPEQHVGARQDLRRLAEAFDCLPDRCRTIVWMRRVEELPQKEVARRLGIGEKAVEKQLIKGARLLAAHLFGSTREEFAGSFRRHTERTHGQHRED